MSLQTAGIAQHCKALRLAAVGAQFASLAEEAGKREIGSYGGGGRVSFDFFLEEGRWRRFAAEAARQAVLKLSAVDAPAGSMTVVFGPGWPGILLHEAVGHGLEADFNRKGTSNYSGHIGQMVASELCTVIDDGTIGSTSRSHGRSAPRGSACTL